ncbi:hypothetical protein AYK21_03840 [Thermoplasmatales archaeon SG8-52-2]|nr:MAG: hypothetical protein AYK21_03840 [Thermoplasmatales archaeon SG8-52-2]
MSKTGMANLPLHGGKAPKWLFRRMVELSKGITDVIIFEYGRKEFLRRISDPFWFQALSCVLGFDWHSSGCTTVTCGALKEAINPTEYGIKIAGGKGKISRKTPDEIEEIGNKFNLSTNKIEELKYSSRMAAKVDNNAIQDGHNLYHHNFFLSEDGYWTVIQQGLNNDTNYARRYHWFSEQVDSYICEPHDGIVGNKSNFKVLDMVSKNSNSCQKTCVDLLRDNPRHLLNDWVKLSKIQSQTTLDDWQNSNKKHNNIECLDMPRSINWKKMKEIYDFQPKNYEELIGMKGVGPRTVRALALISDLIYGEQPSWQDPVKYSFTVGGKDGVPYPVDRKAMDETTEIIKSGIKQAKIDNKTRFSALRRLHKYFNNCYN